MLWFVYHVVKNIILTTKFQQTSILQQSLILVKTLMCLGVLVFVRPQSRNIRQIPTRSTEISIEYRRKFATAIKANFEARCGSDFPPVFYEAMELINPSKWNHEEMFQFDAQSRSIFCKYKPTDFLDQNIELLSSDAFIRRQLEHQHVEVDVIKSELISLKSILSRWDRNEFFTFENKKVGGTNLSWAKIGKKVTGHDNLFGLIDYFLCQNMSSAEAERGFSILKETKTPRRAILSNNYLSNQMRIMLSETLMTSFEYGGAIGVWLSFKKTRRGVLL